jgi:hypothetical protein
MLWPLGVLTPVAYYMKFVEITSTDTDYLAWGYWYTSRMMYSSYMESLNIDQACDYDCATSSTLIGSVSIEVPIYAIAAYAASLTCTDKGYTGDTCSYFEATRDTMITILGEEV